MIRCVCGAAQMLEYSLHKRSLLYSVRTLTHRSSALRNTLTIMLEEDD